jgi:ABC-2 type transport system ATP-binding protein
VLWATHLIDEANADARVIVLHRGRVLADGKVPDIVAQAGAADLKAAFDRLVRAA